MEHVLIKLSRRYPQLRFPIAAGTSTSPEFRDAVYFGKKYDGSLDYSMSGKDRFLSMDTPAGSADVLILHEREDFEKCACALANRCEPKTIPESVGAFMISGLVNWEKVRKHLNKKPEEECLMNGFVWNWLKAKNCDYRDRIILLSSGRYSGVSSERVGLSEEEWLEKSVTIRLYHEITHFVCRSRYPDNIDAIRDEVFADMIGIMAAFGRYDTELAKIFLGIDGTEIPDGARIRYYLKDQTESEASRIADFWISWLAKRVEGQSESSLYDLLLAVFGDMVEERFESFPAMNG